MEWHNILISISVCLLAGLNIYFIKIIAIHKRMLCMIIANITDGDIRKLPDFMIKGMGGIDGTSTVKMKMDINSDSPEEMAKKIAQEIKRKIDAMKERK